ncbi:MAG: 2-hydroxyacid dehydrogenase [Hyphomicrobiaceae bacterium]
MKKRTLLVSCGVEPHQRNLIRQQIGEKVDDILFLADLGDGGRMGALSSATVMLARNTAKELRQGEERLLKGGDLLQFVTAGIDYIPLAGLPPELPVASNGGAYAEPMAEHALAMTLAALKRLFVEHEKLGRLEFDQFRPNRMLSGAVVGILGFGGIGVATARVMRALGAEVHAINRSGRTDEPVAWIGNDSELPALLAHADVLVLSLPLTPTTENLIGRAELAAMKSDAILVNLARGEIVDEGALYAHLRANPAFTACIDAWWVEPVRHGRFAMDHDFMALPNVIASPHNSASVNGWRDIALSRAIANIERCLDGREPRYLVPPSDRLR